MLAQWIIDAHGSGKKVGNTTDFSALYPVKHYEADATKLKAAFGAKLTASTVAIADMYGGDIQFSCSAQFTASAIAAAGPARKVTLTLSLTLTLTLTLTARRTSTCSTTR